MDESLAGDELIRRAKAGDRIAREQVLKNWREIATNIGRQWLSDHAREHSDTSSLAQLACERANERWDDLNADGEVQARAWFLKVLKTVCDLRNKYWDAEKRNHPEGVHSIHGEVGEPSDNEENGPPERLLRSELLQRMDGCLGGLPEIQEEIIRAHYHAGESIAEIAQRLNLSESHVHLLRGKALKWLYDQLADEERD